MLLPQQQSQALYQINYIFFFPPLRQTLENAVLHAHSSFASSDQFRPEQCAINTGCMRSETSIVPRSYIGSRIHQEDFIGVKEGGVRNGELNAILAAVNLLQGRWQRLLLAGFLPLLICSFLSSLFAPCLSVRTHRDGCCMGVSHDNSSCSLLALADCVAGHKEHMKGI